MNSRGESLPPGPAARSGGLAATVKYAASFFLDPLGFVGDRFDTYGDVYYAPSKGVGLFVVRRAEHAREVLVTQADAFEKAHTAFQALGQVLGEGLLTSEGDVWRRHRRLANPAFAKRAIDGYVAAIAAEAEATRDRMPIGEVVDAASAMTDLTLRIVGRTLLGTDVASDVTKIGRAMGVFQSALAVPQSAPFFVRAPVNRWLGGAVSDLHEIIDRMIAKRRQKRLDPPDLAQMLLDATDPEDPTSKLSEKDVKDELVTFLLAGHETTSNALSWAMYLLSKRPEAEEAMRSEIRSVLRGRTVTASDIERLVFTTQVFKETMRLYPPAYVLARRASRDTTLGGYDVKKGSEVVVWVYYTHRDPEVFPDPAAFKPERFTQEAEALLPKSAYMPFGAGPRICIGKSFAMAEGVAALSTLYQDRTYIYEGKRPPTPKARITLAPGGGLPMRVARA